MQRICGKQELCLTNLRKEDFQELWFLILRYHEKITGGEKENLGPEMK